MYENKNVNDETLQKRSIYISYSLQFTYLMAYNVEITTLIKTNQLK